MFYAVAVKALIAEYNKNYTRGVKEELTEPHQNTSKEWVYSNDVTIEGKKIHAIGMSRDKAEAEDNMYRDLIFKTFRLLPHLKK